MKTVPGTSSTAVYRYYDRFGVLIYVGITGRGTGRQREHTRRAEWWPYVARQDITHHDDRFIALAIEADLIQRHAPPFNLQHNGAHSTARHAYERWMSEVNPTETVDKQYARLAGHLSLEILTPRDHNNMVTFATRPDAWLLAQMLIVRKHPYVRFEGRKCGQLTTCPEAVGPILHMRASVGARAGDITSAVAFVTSPSAPPAREVALKHIIVNDVNLVDL